MKAGQRKSEAMFRSETFLCTVLVSVFLVFGVIGILHHSMWRDETYPWLLARFSGSLRDLYREARYDTHFMLWHQLVWILTRFTDTCRALQWLHLALATASAWVVVRFSPFTRTQKALYCFSYFTFFEYCLISREYVCVGLLMFGLCALCDWRKESFVLQALLLFLLSNINVFATILVFSFVLASGLEWVRRESGRQLWARRKWPLIASGIILCAALVGVGIQLIKPPDWEFAVVPKSWRHGITAWDASMTLSTPWRGYVPIPKAFPALQNLRWGSNFLLDSEYGNVSLGVILSIGLVVGSAWTLRHSRMALVLYLSGMILMLLFQSVMGLGALRHLGLYFILYVACLWSQSTWGTSQQPLPAASPAARWERAFFQSLLVVQVVAGLYAWIIHFRTPFSGSKLAADFIRQNGYANWLIVGSPEERVSSMTAYLDRPIYYPDSARYGTFYRETTAKRKFSTAELMYRVAQLVRTEQRDILFVCSGSVDTFRNGVAEPLRSAWLRPDGSVSSPSEAPDESSMQMRLLAQIRGTIVNEDYSLYLVRPHS